MTRKTADCRKYPSETNCTLTLTGEEDEVVRAASEHAASVHGHENTPELREQIRGMLEDADEKVSASTSVQTGSLEQGFEVTWHFQT
ncbi:DUF1059 domain-containing protein, partial [Streptomyces rubiginosohelvolus]